MPPRKRSSRGEAGRVVRRTLADGTTKEYKYATYKKAAPRVVSDSVEALIRAYKQSPAWGSLAPLTQRSYATYLRHLGGIAHFRAEEVKRREILIIRDAVAKTSGNGAATAFVRASSVLFGWAVDHDWVNFTPVHKIKRLPGGHLPAWSMEQTEVALSGLPEHFRRAVILGVYTGQRRSDLCSVKWSAYDGDTIRFTQQKTGAEVVLAVHSALRAELDEWKRTASAVTILTDAKGRPWVPNALSVTLPKALHALGLPPHLNIHGLRKLFSASIADGGGTTHQIAAGTGHRTLGMVQLYTASANQRKLGAEAIALLPKFGKKD